MESPGRYLTQFAPVDADFDFLQRPLADILFYFVSRPRTASVISLR